MRLVHLRFQALLLILCVCSPVRTEEKNLQPATAWKHTGVAGLTLTQVSYTDWAQGGENSLSFTTTLDGKSLLEQQMVNWTTDYKFAFGQSRLGSQGLRKTDDKIDLSTVLAYSLGGLIDPYLRISLKTQFAKGYVYDGTGNATQVSAFFDPAFLTQSVGAGYQAAPEIKLRAGVALREVVTSRFTQYADDPGTKEIEKIKIDGGVEFVANIDWQIDTQILFSSQIELFSAFRKLHDVVIRNNNTLSAKINQYVTALANVQLIHEKQISPRTQVKQVFALGLSYTLF